MRFPRELSALFTLILSIGAFPGTLRAADGLRHAISVGAGIRADAIREDLVVPVAFAGPGGRLMAGYEGWLGPGLVQARADLGLSFLWNRWGHSAATLDPSAALAWTARVFWGKSFHVALGPVWVIDNRVNFLYSWDDAHAYWLGSEWMGPQVRFGSRLAGAWRMEGAASLALAGFAVRPPAHRYNKQEALNHVSFYASRPFQDQGFVTPLDLQALRVDLAASHAPYQGPAVLGGWAYGVDLRFTRMGSPATNLNLSLCLYARRAYPW